ncbi:MAG: MFS transporter [Verrucomicrobiales bacterium]|nr:MFS transporter [Verrucomicrobiales bacterium]
MSGEAEPHRHLVRRTFIAEAVRAVSAGVIETALATFAILIAVNQFQSGAGLKSFLLASPAVGLLGSLLIVPLVVKWQIRSSLAAAMVSLVSMAGFVVSALGSKNEICFVIGISMGIGMIGMAIPMQTHYLRLNYPGKSRGRLFSVTIFIRALTAMIVSWSFGVFLDHDFDRYPVLLWLMVGAAAVSAVCHFYVPSEVLRPNSKRRNAFWDSVHISREDRVFVRLLVAAMVMGIGVLSANALRVDYLVNPEHGLEFDVKTVSLITGIVPSVVRLISTFFWGWLFDRVNFFKLRIVANLVFLAGVILYFVWTDVRLILLGSALFGLARGGGEIMFNLFVTKLAPGEHIADYMSVHTFLAGLRILAAPFLGFFLVEWANVSVMTAVSVTFIVASVLIVGSARQVDGEKIPEDRMS